MKMISLLLVLASFRFCSFPADNATIVELFNSHSVEIEENNIEKKTTTISKGLEIISVCIKSSPQKHIISNEQGEYTIIKQGRALHFLGKLSKAFTLFERETTFYVGGWAISDKGTGNFVVFALADYKAERVFKTTRFVYDKSLNCESFCEDGFLNLEVTDNNKDGIIDLVFTGFKCIYCEGLEEGLSWKDREHLEKKPVEIKYVSHIQENQISWKESK